MAPKSAEFSKIMLSFVYVQVVCLLGFIVNSSAHGYSGGGFVGFSIFSGFLHAVIWFFLHLVHAIPQILANYYIVSISLLFISLVLK